MRGTPQKRLMLFDFRIRDKLRNSQGARCYRARIVKLFRPPGVYVCASSRTARNARDFRPLDDGRAATRSMTRETSHGNLAFAQRAGIFSVGKKNERSPRKRHSFGMLRFRVENGVTFQRPVFHSVSDYSAVLGPNTPANGSQRRV